MAEINISCDLSLRRNKEEKEKVIYTDNLASYFALVNGTKPRPKLIQGEISPLGFWVRQRNYLITPFGDKEGNLKADKDRYIIYWAPGCNWSNRPVIVRDLLGLQDVILDYKVGKTGESNTYGWGFPEEKLFKDKYTGVYFLSDLYLNQDKKYTGRATTPTLVDLKTKKAVNNDYHRLTNYLEVQFRKYQPKDPPDLYPKKFRKVIDEFNDWLFPTINNGHYRMAFCQSWEAYKEAYDDFFESIEKIDERLKTNRFLFGDYITDADVRLYVTLVRWETSYYHNVGPIKKRITEYENVWGYVKDLFAIPEFRKYTFFEFPEKKTKGIFASYAERIAAQVPYDELWKTDGERKALSADPENVYKKHPEGETAEDYQSEISYSKWNNSDPKDRDPKNRTLSVDASINPIASKLRD